MLSMAHFLINCKHPYRFISTRRIICPKRGKFLFGAIPLPSCLPTKRILVLYVQVTGGHAGFDVIAVGGIEYDLARLVASGRSQGVIYYP